MFVQDCCPAPPAGRSVLPCSTQGWQQQVGNPPLRCPVPQVLQVLAPTGLVQEGFTAGQEFSCTGKFCCSQTWPWSPQHEETKPRFKMNITYFLNMSSTLALLRGGACLMDTASAEVNPAACQLQPPALSSPARRTTYPAAIDL